MISAPTILSQETAISCQVMNNVIETAVLVKRAFGSTISEI